MTMDFQVGDRIRIRRGIWRKESFEAEVTSITATIVRYRRIDTNSYDWFRPKMVGNWGELQVERIE